MRALAVWGVCPDTGPACFSGRTTPACTCATSRGAGHKRSARSSVQQPASKENRYQQYRPERAPAAVASLDWEGDWDELAAPAQSSQDQTKSWDSGFFAPVSQTASKKPLKINRDLLLYRARLSRNAAFRASSNKEKSRRQKDCESTLRRVLAMDPTDGRAYVGLGKLLVQQKRFEEARKLYDDGAAATGGLNEYIWQAWAYLESKQNNVGQARKLYDAALVANNEHAASWHGWGLLEKRQGNFRKARDLWMKGIKATKSKPNSYLYQALALMATELNYTEEARQWFMEGTKTVMGAQSHAIWHAWAGMEASQGDVTVVRYLYRRGLEANPRSRFTYLSWGLFEKQQGSLENARALLKQGHQLNPRDPAILQAWALLEQDNGNSGKARELLEQGSKMDPWHIPIWQAWGVLEFRAGNIETARALFQEGVWADPVSKDVAQVFQAWAVLEAQHGTVQLARELFKCAVKANPQSEVSWASWALLEEKEGLYTRANELRSYSLQEQTSVVPPLNLGTQPDDPLITSVFKQIGDWITRVEDGRAKAMSRARPRALQHLKEEDEGFWDTEPERRRAPPVLDLKEAHEYHAKPLALPKVVDKRNLQKPRSNPRASASR
ncbi:hypothetical protein WJX79_002845 [Trebouxia sp. C0005]